MQPFDIGPETLENSDISITTDPEGNLVLEGVAAGGELTIDEWGIFSEIAGSSRSVTSQSTDYSAEDGDVVLVDASGGPVSITLPEAEADVSVIVEKTDGSENDVTIASVSTGDVNYSSEETLVAQGESVDLVSDGNDWYSV